MTKKLRFKNEMQEDAKVSPIVENAKLPEMDDSSAKRKTTPKASKLMDDDVESEKAMMMSIDKQDRRFMKPVPEELYAETIGKTSSKDIASTGEIDEQEELPKARSVGKGEGYVRLCLRVKGNKISLVGARTVEGPLVTPKKIHSGLIYEANYDQKRIGFGWIADAGERRSFPHPKPKPGQEGHHVTDLSSFEFNARISKEDFVKANLPDVEVSVYRVKEEPQDASVSPERFDVQFSRELREVAHLKGINLNKLNDDDKKELQKLK